MPRGVLIVESHPASPDRADEFTTWYGDVHIPEVLGLDGFVGGRLFRPVDGGPVVAVYDIEADDLKSLGRTLSRAAGDGTIAMSDCIQLDPPPRMRFLELSAEH